MKKGLSLLLAITMLLSLAACGAGQQKGTDAADSKDSSIPSAPFSDVTVKTSPDKYTWYVKNYVGKNLASVGYTSLGGDRMDSYGAGYIQLILLTPNGEYVDIDSEDDLKNWRVVGQSPAANTEIKYTFMVDDEGNEYDSLLDFQNIEEIVLALAPVRGEAAAPPLTDINAAADRYTLYVRDYTGRNLTQCGYTSLGGDRMDQYGNAYVRLSLITENGDYVDIENDDELKKWYVTEQNILPNAELKLTYQLDAEGNEYENLIAHQNIEEIELFIMPVNASDEVSGTPLAEAADDAEEQAPTVSDGGLRPEFKAAMDAYEAFYDEYCAFMTTYNENPTDMTLLRQYAEIMDRAVEAEEAFSQWDDEDLNSEESKYYLEVNNRVMQKLLDVVE